MVETTTVNTPEKGLISNACYSVPYTNRAVSLLLRLRAAKVEWIMWWV